MPLQSTTEHQVQALLADWIRRVVSGGILACEPFSDDMITAICHEAASQGVAPLFYPFLARQQALPDSLTTFLRTAHEKALILRDYCHARLLDLQPDLCRHGRVVLMQGMALDERVYAAPLVRPMSDIDLLLPDGSLDAVCDALGRHGFAPRDTSRHVWLHKGLQIDLHTDLWGSERIPARGLFCPTIRPDWVPSKNLAGYFLPPDNFLALHAAFHAMKHGFSRLIWDCDLLLLDRAGLFDRVDDLDPHRICRRALQRLTSATVAPPRWSPRYRVYERMLPRAHRSGSGETLLALALKSSTDTARYLWSSIMPPRTVLRDMYGDHSASSLVWRRLYSLSSMLIKGRL
jgi:hypothetical protein